MSTNKTQNLSLHSWEASDPFRRTEFNENFAAIDGAVGANADAIAAETAARTAAIASCSHVLVGTYTGNGTTNTASQFINLGVTPKAVLVLQSGNILQLTGAIWGGMATTSLNCSTVRIAEGGFTAIGGTSNSTAGNVLYNTYSYVALY